LEEKRGRLFCKKNLSYMLLLTVQTILYAVFKFI
jgi:hypothetical protein